MTSEKKISVWNVIKGFCGYYKNYKGIFIMDLVCALIVACIDIGFPQLLRFFTNDFFKRDPLEIMNALFPIAVILFVMYLIRTLCQYFIVRWGHTMGAYMEAQMRRDLFAQFQRLSFSYYDKNNSGEMMSRIVTDLFDISELAHHGPENILICTLKIVGSFVLLALINWQLTLLMLIATIVMVIYSVVLNIRRSAVFTENRERMAGMNSQLQDSLGGIKTVKSFGNEQHELNKFDDINSCFVDTKKRSYLYLANFQSINSAFTGLLYLITVVFGGYCVANGTMQVADLAIFALYIGIFIAPIELLINFMETFQKGYAGFKRFMQIMALHPDVEQSPEAKALPDNFKAEIEYDNVGFSYDNCDAVKTAEAKKQKDWTKHSSKLAVLDNLNLRIEEGQSVALVGPSGGGKSTTCSLLPRFYDVCSGRITIDGIDIRDLKIDSLRKQIGIVQQDIYLFGGTIKDNIAYANPKADFSKIVQAAKKAYIHDFIMSLEDGYNTEVGERGTRLSGGQKQRIAIARLFMRNPKIIVLDEATSALDNEAEHEVQKSLEELSRGRTTIVIAHRLSTIKAVDKIAVVEDGRIAEFGTHEQLMAMKGIYCRYYNMQFKAGSE